MLCHSVHAEPLGSVSPEIDRMEVSDEVKKELKLWRSNFGERGYFVRTVGDEVTAEVIRKYIEYHKHEEVNVRQLKLF